MVEHSEFQKRFQRASRWSTLSRAGKSPLVKSFSLVPALSGLLTLLFTTGLITIDDISWKIMSWFLGANLIGLFVILFRANCPEIILYFENMFQYGRLYPMILPERYNKLKSLLIEESKNDLSLMKYDHWYQYDGFTQLVQSQDWISGKEMSDERKVRLLFYNHIYHNYFHLRMRVLLFSLYYSGGVLILLPLIFNVGIIFLASIGIDVISGPEEK